MSTDILFLFINYCDNNSPNLNRETTLQENYKLFGLSATGHFFSKHELENFIAEKIKLICSDNPSQDIRILKKIRESLIFEGIIKRKKVYYHYLDIVLTLEGIIKNDIKKIPDFKNLIWDEIIQLVKSFLIFSQAYCQIKKEIFKKEIDTAKSIANLNSIGCDIKIVNCNIVIENEQVVLRKIEKGIKNVGGKTFLNLLFQNLLYVHEFERFLILRQGNQGVTAKIEIEVPHAYLFNLAIKHIDEKAKKKIDLKNEFEEIILISKQFCFVKYQVQNYSIWDDIVHKTREPLEYFNDLIIRGALFDIPQFQARYAYQFCNYIIHKEAEEFGRIFPYSLNNLIKVINHLFTLANDKSINQFYTIRLVQDLGIELNIVDKILNDLSQHCNEVNSNYFSPTDYLNISFWEKPLLRARNGEYILLPKSFIALSFYEAIIGNARNLGYKNIDINVGIHIENFLKEKLKTKDIVYTCGKYKEKVNGKNEVGEADIIIETNSSILLFECKKKSLTRKAKSGSNNAIFLDLVGSIFDSQFQCFKTDSIFRINKKITIKENDKETEIYWRERIIEKFTFTLSDYGAVQDRVILDQILLELLSHDFTLINNNHSDEKEFSMWDKKYKNFSKKRVELANYLNVINDSNHFFYSGFMNLHQVMFLLDKSHNTESFYKIINDSKFVSRGSFDFYQEYFYSHLFHKYFVMKD